MNPPANHHKLLVTVLILAVIVGVLFYVASKTDKGYVIQVASNNSNSASTLAVKAGNNSVDVTACRPNPPVAQSVLNGKVTFINRDSKSHKLLFSGSSLTYTVPPKGVNAVSFTFAKALGSVGYSCDGIPSAGAIIITAKK